MLTYTLLFLTGLFGSLGHCLGMCGGFVLACALHAPQAQGVRGRVLPPLVYNLGRVYTYALLGGLAGAFGGWVALSSRATAVRASVPVLAGLAMVVLGLSRMGLVPPLGAIRALKNFTAENAEHAEVSRASSFGVYFDPLRSQRSLRFILLRVLSRLTRFLSGLVRGGSLSHLFAFGLFNGLLPCGLSYAVALTAAGAGSFADGFLTMAAFGLGTVPALFALGISSSLARGGHLQGRLFRVAGALIVALGVLSILRGIGLADPTGVPACCAPSPP
jgi:sulfite exporter TauE/SafE